MWVPWCVLSLTRNSTVPSVELSTNSSFSRVPDGSSLYHASNSLTADMEQQLFRQRSGEDSSEAQRDRPRLSVRYTELGVGQGTEKHG